MWLYLGTASIELGWYQVIKNNTQNIARERNEDPCDEDVNETLSLCSDQLVLTNDSGIDKSIETRRKDWAPRARMFCRKSTAILWPGFVGPCGDSCRTLRLALKHVLNSTLVSPLKWCLRRTLPELWRYRLCIPPVCPLAWFKCLYLLISVAEWIIWYLPVSYLTPSAFRSMAQGIQAVVLVIDIVRILQG